MTPFGAEAEPRIATFSRLLDLSAAALDALESEDFDEVERILAERGSVVLDADSPGAATRPQNPAAERELLAAALRLRDADRRLTLALTSKRDEIADDLDAIESGEAVRSAYGSKTLQTGRINFVR